jgi:hypothetical protein
MLAKCLMECYHGPRAWKFTPDGGDQGDGIYDIDPLDPIAQYFEFPPGTVKYQKIFGTVKVAQYGKRIVDIPSVEKTTVVASQEEAVDPVEDVVEPEPFVEPEIVVESPIVPKFDVLPEEEISKKKIMARLDALGIEYKQLWTKAELFALLPKE